MSDSFKITDRQIRILSLLSQGYSQSEIASMICKSQPYVYKTAKILHNRGFIESETLGYNVKRYRLTSSGIMVLSKSSRGVDEPYNQLASVKSVKNSIKTETLDIKGRDDVVRLHNIEIALRIPYTRLEQWRQYHNRILEIPDYKTVDMKNNRQAIFETKGIRVRTTSRSVLFRLDDIYAKDLETAQGELTGRIVSTAKKMNQILNYTVYKPVWANIELSSIHIAFLKDPVAGIYKDQDMSARIRIDNRERIHIDFSKRVPELEFVDSREAQEDSRKWEDLRKGTENFEEFAEDLLKDKFNHRDIQRRVSSGERAIGQIKSDISEMAHHTKELAKYSSQHIPTLSKMEKVLDMILSESEKEEAKSRLRLRGRQRIINHFV